MSKKTDPQPTPEQMRAALEALEQELERRRIARGEKPRVRIVGVPPRPGKRFDGETVVTGVPRPGRDGDAVDVAWKPTGKPQFPEGIGPRAPQPKPVAPEPPELPTKMHYVWITVRGPRSDSDTGVIADGQYGTAGGILYLEDVDGNPLASQRLRPDDNAAAVARRLLREYRGRSGFYDGPNFNRDPRVFH